MRKLRGLIVWITVLLIPAVANAQDGSHEQAEIILVPDLPSEQITTELMETAVDGLERFFAEQGFEPVAIELLPDDSIRVVFDRVYLRLILDWVDELTLARPEDAADVAAPLLEFVDFSMFGHGDVEERVCILTTEQVTLAEAALDEGEPPLAYTDYTCPAQTSGADPDPALLQEDGTPFVTIMTGAGLAEASAVRFQHTDAWAVQIILDLGGDRVDDFHAYIATHVAQSMAIVLDGRLISYPRIQPDLADMAARDELTELTISGDFTCTEAATLAAQLNGEPPRICLRIARAGPAIADTIH